MAPVNGKPFLTYVLDYLAGQGVNKVILSVGYLKNQIINYFGGDYKSLKIEYAIENEPLGTGGAVKLSSGFCNQDEVFVLNGDTCFFPDLKAMEDLHFLKTADITIAIKQMTDTTRYGLVMTDFPEQKFSLENDIFKKSCSKFKMQAFRSDAFFLDMGIPKDYVKAQTMIPLHGNI